MKLKGRALIRSMPHIQWQQQPEWLSDRMTKWRCDSRTRNKRSILVLLTVPSRGWHWAMCTSVGPTWLTHLPPPWWLHHFLLCSMQCEYGSCAAFLPSPGANDNIIITQQSPTFGTRTRSWSSCAWGAPFVSFSSGGSDWTAKWHSDSQLSAKSHSARFLVNDDDSARCCCCRCWSLPPGQLDIFSAPLWPYQRRHMSLRVFSPLLSAFHVWAETAAEGDTCLSECQSRWCTAGVQNI